MTELFLVYRLGVNECHLHWRFMWKIGGEKEKCGHDWGGEGIVVKKGKDI